MIDPMTWAVLALMVVVGICLAKQAVVARREKDWLPKELRDAELAYAERTFRSAKPALVAKVDRAYRNKDRIVLLELKTRERHRVYASDMIELSAQRVAVHAHTGEEVEDYGYVLTAPAGRAPPKVHQVALLSTVELERLMLPRSRVLAGEAEPRYMSQRGLCRNCRFRRECGSRA